MPNIITDGKNELQVIPKIGNIYKYIFPKKFLNARTTLGHQRTLVCASHRCTLSFVRTDTTAVKFCWDYLSDWHGIML